MKHIAFGIIGIALLITVGCGGSTGDTTGTSDASPATQANLPDGLFVAKAPAGAMSVTELKAEDRTGEEVTVTGRIGGNVSPFVEGRAMFMVTDIALAVCDPEAGDHCETPWDSCCEPSDKILENMITVQVVDESGDVIKRAMKGEHGLEGLTQLTVRGTVNEQSGEVLVLDANEIYVHETAEIPNIS